MNHIAGAPDPVFEVPEDRGGLFIYSSAKYRGPLRWMVEPRHHSFERLEIFVGLAASPE